VVPDQSDDAGQDRAFDTANAKAVLTAYVDDYAEVWVNGGNAARAAYHPASHPIQANIPNRRVIADAVKAGDKVEIAIFRHQRADLGAPRISCSRQASVEFYK